MNNSGKSGITSQAVTSMARAEDRTTLDLARAALLQGCADAAKAEKVESRALRKRAKWPMVSWRAGCQPEQVEECNAACRRLKIGAEYLPNGDVVWSGPQAKREHLRSIGQMDRS